ncbi:MAG: biotin/lipoyl-containing protein [Opitutales bacterium]
MKQLRITVEGKTYDVEVELLNENNGAPAPRPASVASARVNTPAPAAPKPAAPKPAASGSAGEGSVVSPLAAVVVSIDVAVGDQVEAGQNVATLEAMKMNTLVQAPASGVVKSIEVNASEAVEEGQTLLVIA